MAWLYLAVFALPPGSARSDAARAMQDVADKMTAEELQQARMRAKGWKAKTENRKPKTENRKPKTENRKPKTENRKPKTENRKPMTHLPRVTGPVAAAPL
jgi:sRNA-binding protein